MPNLRYLYGVPARRGVTGYFFVRKYCIGFGLLICMLIVSGYRESLASKSDASIASLCDRAAIRASQSNGVPLDLLRAVSRTETGRKSSNGLQPWPWTVNMEGSGRWFATRDDARAYVFLHFKNGARSFDVGCYQINYKWHGAAFRSIDDMFDPDLNAQYAAGYLSELYHEFGSWTEAVGAYHSRTPEFADKYTERFGRIRAELTNSPDSSQNLPTNRPYQSVANSHELVPYSNSRPLIARGTLELGSLVPILREPNDSLQPYALLRRPIND